MSVQFFQDNYVEASDTTLTSHTPDIGSAYGAQANNSDFTVEGGTGFLKLGIDSQRYAVNVADPGNDDYYSEARVKTGGTANTDRAGPTARANTNGFGSQSLYKAWINGSTEYLYVSRDDAGTENILDYYLIPDFSPSSFYIIKLDVATEDASTVRVRVYLDGTFRLNVPDTDANRITTRGYAGTFMRGLNARIDYSDAWNPLSGTSIPALTASMNRRRR